MVFKLDAGSLQAAAAEATAPILSGKLVSGALLDQVKAGVEALKQRGITPTLAVIRVGDDPASAVYVNHKIRACERVGIESRPFHLPADVTAEALHELLESLNADREVNGILLQLPLPAGLSSQEAIIRIAPSKDVDGFHPVNLGCLSSGRAELEPCTPRGIMTLLLAAGVDPAQKEAVVIGRSVIVGRPMAQMLVRANATVTICHRHTPNLAEHVRRADILVVATGVPGLVPGDWVKPGAVVLDVGISREADGRLVGDVDYEGASQRAQWITPVPGGVGPMTVATLMENTVRASCLHHQVLIVDGQCVDADEVGARFVRAENLELTFLGGRDS
jgi:methylenetetrahydrofolate dehydrogenase (NADP+) / methenyltetrahydrofolate cyclohydrolase